MMLVQPLACALLFVVGASAQTTEEGFMTIQTVIPTETEGASTSACFEVCVVEPCTQCPLTNPLHTSETIPQLTFCNGVYTNTPCSTATGMMSIPQGETPIPSSLLSTSTAPVSVSRESSSTAPSSTTSRGSSSNSESHSQTPSATSSGTGSAKSSTSSPGAASSAFNRDAGFGWLTALFAWTLL
ncbi:hypothetical protein BU23DRAFT_549272 [Bimuria novae-zelandiae CBS 107.79]|uniref:Uncharacterized protein n=1 Tax=Bimuria novae-zelandiae CBS 107.79 TaxID=1447943 RepID=A0A6A5VNG4_9PLEO|nr:hypothetical protein BU23DRAFT_549272 [Bimuria novae-zelandiae CBS 107.79]